jgi:predicted RNA-binding Zn ribbon-like protein
MDPQINTPDFDFDSGDLCLDFGNTANWHASDSPVEFIEDYAALVSWGEAAGIITPERAAHLRQLALKRAGEAAAAYDRAIQLREAVFRIFSQYYHDEVVDPGDMQLLNAVLSASLPHLQVISSTGGFDWKWSGDSDDFDQIIWPVARLAAELLTSEQLSRVRVCEDDRGCGFLFIDTTRNHSRRWCSMESCGNRAKARRHYARQRLAP